MNQRNPIESGTYGIVSVVTTATVEIKAGSYTAEQLREAAHMLNQMAETLDDVWTWHNGRPKMPTNVDPFRFILYKDSQGQMLIDRANRIAWENVTTWKYNDGWIENTGTCPTDRNVPMMVRFANGEEHATDNPLALIWTRPTGATHSITRFKYV